MTTTYGQSLSHARQALRQAGIENPGLDARLLLAEAAGLDMAALISGGEDPVPALAQARFQTHLKCRLNGVPVSRILGRREFWGLSFRLSDATLDPRPETEILVEAVLAEARRRFPPDLAICDLGTGSGAILIALLTELPEARGVASDISAAALDTAWLNAERLGVATRISFYHGDFAAAPEGPFDIVVSNPPYIPSAAINDLVSEVRDADPRAALDGGADGLDAFRVIAARAADLLLPNGFLAFETGYDQGAAVAALCRENGLEDVHVRADLAGIPRVVTATRGKSEWRAETPRRAAKKALGKVG